MPLSPVLPAAVLAAPTPSALDGIAPATEFAYREFGCEVIAELCILLKVPQAVRATACALLQRFYFRRSLAAFDAHAVAMAAVFLAGKAEESARRMRDIVNVCYAVKTRRAGAPPPRRALVLGGDVYVAWKARLIRIERLILKDVGFQVHAGVSSQHAHSFILFFVRVLGGGPPLAQAAWNFLNDALARDLVCRHEPEAIAAAGIFLAARVVGFPLPTNEPWMAVFGTTQADVEAIAAAILELRERTTPIGWLPSLRPDWAPRDDNE